MPDPEQVQQFVAQGWTHSYEEDSGDVQVFRPSHNDFPPARGRESFVLQPDGNLEVLGPGPDDRSVTTNGTWSMTGDRLELHPNGATPRKMIVESADPDRLVVRPLPEE